MARAVLYLPDLPDRRLASRSVAGRSLALRAIVAAARGGAATVGVPVILRTPALEAALRRVRGLAGVVRWLDARDRAAAGAFASEPCLLLPATNLVEPRTLAGLWEGPSEEGGAAIAESAEAGAPVLLAPLDLVERLWPRLASGEALGPELVRYIEETRPKLRCAAGLLVPVPAEAQLRDAEAALYVALGTDDDTGVDRFLHRRCSRPITRLLARTPVTPNHVSLASLAVGLGAFWAFWHATPASALLGVALYSVAVVLDHVDGELARLTFQESRLGARLDWAVDTIIHSTLVLGMAVSADRGPLMMALGLLGGVGVALSALLAHYLPREIAVGETVGGALRNMGNRDFFYLVLLAFALFRWALPSLLPPLAAVVAVGSHSYWIACVARLRRGAAAG